MSWRRLGLIFQPENRLTWLKNYAWVPIPERLNNGLFRVYFSGRNSQNLSLPAAFTIDIENPTEIIELTPNPLLPVGELGAFDDSGVIPSWILNHDNKKYMFYSGWMQGKNIPYHSAIGLAISDDNGKTFKKFSNAPIIGLSSTDPFFTASCAVIVENSKWKIWYTSNTKWNVEAGKANPKYLIKYAESNDGIDWQKKGCIAIDFENQDEYAITRPWVINDHGLYKMWFTYRGQYNKIGYAESNDGIDWTRLNNGNELDIADQGWDSQMVSYGAVVTHKGKKYMFYNGNNFGEKGIGLAVYDDK